jgi:hypothetical protein
MFLRNGGTNVLPYIVQEPKVKPNAKTQNIKHRVPRKPTAYALFPPALSSSGLRKASIATHA